MATTDYLYPWREGQRGRGGRDREDGERGRAGRMGGGRVRR